MPGEFFALSLQLLCNGIVGHNNRCLNYSAKIDII